ncbi:MAG TPA: hypothetical protein VFX98_09950 [Longimicrobiaceae bacterium]|nr:hypothetical protein [Longimicrobiaceae bacterium]
MNVPTTSRTRLLGMALLTATFVAGGLAGAAFSRGLEAREPTPAAATSARECEGDRRGGRTAILDQLGLSADQRAAIDRIMERRRTETEAFWNQEGVRMRAIVDSTREEIRTVLTPEQRARYDQLRAEHKERRKAEHAAREAERRER